MNALTIKEQFGAVSTVFAGVQAENDLGAGISGGYGMIGIKGKVWSTRYKGNETVLMREDGDGPRGSIEVVILKASQAISKVWYEKGFEEGTKAAPDCFSANGVTPDPTSTKKQANVCATCPRNAFGSAVKQDGTAGKGKACSDSKRLAVVPLADINNEMLGGPMMLRVPAGSLNEVATYGEGVRKLGFPYYGVATRMSFDPADAYPKLLFAPIRPLTDEEATKVMALRGDARVDRILAETEYETSPPAEQPAGLAFETPAPAQAPAGGTPTPAAIARRTATAKPPAAVVTPAVTAPAPAANPAAAPAAGGFGAGAPAVAAPPVQVADTKALDDDLDKKLEELMGPAAA